MVDEDNPKYAEFIDLLKNISEADSSVSFQQTNSFHDLLIENLDQYYTYNGSLTTPPCSEVVTWLDFIDPIPLSHEQVNLERRRLFLSRANSISHAFRLEIGIDLPRALIRSFTVDSLQIELALRRCRHERASQLILRSIYCRLACSERSETGKATS